MNAPLRPEAERFLASFQAFFAAPSPASYAPLFHPEGTLEDAGMAAPVPASETGAAIAHVLDLIPDLRIEMLRAGIHGDRVFVEARNTASIGGRALDWGAVYRVHLKEGLVHRGRRFYDQAELLAPLLPPDALGPPFDPHVHRAAGDDAIAPRAGDPDPEAFVARLAGAWTEGTGLAFAALFAPDGCLRPPGAAPAVARGDLASWRRAQTARFPDMEAEIADWAAVPGTGPEDERVVFVEWRVRARHLGARVRLDRVDRHVIGPDGLIRDCRKYADTLGLLERANPGLAEARARLLSR